MTTGSDSLRQIRTKSYFHSSYRRRFKQNQECLQKKSDPINSQTRHSIYDTIPWFKPNKKQRKHNNTQLPYSTKSCYQQKDLQNKLHQPERANGESVRRCDV
ncbi:Hypothetical_protein [Hexamita inflata]|uniref:Hypothetical_protein n=1 Tax=Hexamita inflata TaxID=28002 RepID=A0AA86RAI7_9EUKA|nr:Hypothetical protein HINF_LOCUS58046 [Hexamita inflata]